MAQFLANIKTEDSEVTSVGIFNYDGDEIAGSALLGSIIPTGFQILFNEDQDQCWIVDKSSAGTD